MFQVKLDESNSTRRRIPVLLVDATDGYTPETGLSTFTVNVSQNGTILGSQTQTLTEVGNGIYYYTLGTGAVNTLGWVTVNVSATGCRNYNAIVQIMAYDAMDVVRLGLTAIPNAAQGLAGSLPTANASGQVTLTDNGITAAKIDTAAVNEIVDAVWSANISTNSAAAAWANDTMGKRVLRSSSNTDATEAVVADAVWEEPRGDHDTGNTMGHSLDQIRKANYITEGTVNSTTGATTTSFRTNLTAVNDTYQHQTILFVNSVALNGQSAPILSYAQTNGVITLGDGLTVAPSLNDEFVILPTHVYPMSYIVTNILEGNTSTTSYAAGDVGNILARLHNMIEADGADFRYTTNALEQAPSGGAGSWPLNNDQTTGLKRMISAIVGVGGETATPGVLEFDMVGETTTLRITQSTDGNDRLTVEEV